MMSSHVPIRPEETMITAEHRWRDVPSIMERMNYLTYDYLTKIATAPEGWAVLFQDPADGRYGNSRTPLATCTEEARPVFATSLLTRQAGYGV